MIFGRRVVETVEMGAPSDGHGVSDTGRYLGGVFGFGFVEPHFVRFFVRRTVKWAQGFDEGRRIGVSIVWALGQSALEHDREPFRYIMDELVGRLDGTLEGTLHHRKCAVHVTEWTLPGHALVENDAEGVQVGSSVDVARAVELLRRHVGDRPEDVALRRQLSMRYRPLL